MHVAYVTPYHLSAYVGGQEQYFHSLALALHRSGHQVSYLCAQSRPTQTPYPVITLPSVRLGSLVVPTRSWINAIQKLKPGLVHIASITLPYLLLGFSLKTQTKVPLVYSVLAPSTHPNLLYKLSTQLSLNLIKHIAVHLITLNPRDAQHLTSNSNHPPVSVLPPVLPSAFLEVPEVDNSTLNHRPKQLLFVGTLDRHHYYKGLNTLLDSLPLIKSPYRLTICGGGDSFLRLKRQYQSLEPTVHFTGPVPTRQLIRFYRQADLLILPSSSVSEGFGIVLLESLSQGTPVITTQAAGAAMLLKNRSFARIIPPNNPAYLAQAINHQPQKSIPLKSAITFARQFNSEVTVKQALKIYQNILN